MPKKNSANNQTKGKQTEKVTALIAAPPKKSTGRKCTVCSHSKVKEINSVINTGKSFRAISCQFWGSDSSRESIRRHTEHCLKLQIRALIEERKISNAVEHYEELKEQLNVSKRLQEAAVNWLTDPVTEEINLDARADEVTVIYLDFADPDAQGKPKRKKAKLQEIINNIQSVNANFAAQTSIVKTTDIRDYALKTVAAVDAILDKFARVDGHYQKEKENTDELAALKRQIETVAANQGTDYQTELALFLRDYANKIKPELKAKLTLELN